MYQECKTNHHTFVKCKNITSKIKNGNAVVRVIDRSEASSIVVTIDRGCFQYETQTIIVINNKVLLLIGKQRAIM